MGLYNLQGSHDNEHLYLAASFAESHWLLGVACKFTPCTSYTRDTAYDPHPTYGDPVDINIVFDDEPKATLEKLNWLAEGEDLPYMANVSSIVFPKYKEWKLALKNPSLTPEAKAQLLADHNSFLRRALLVWSARW